MAERIQRGLTIRDMTKVELISASGLPAEIVQEYLEGSRQISFPELAPIAEALGVSLMRFLVRTNPFEPDPDLASESPPDILKD